MQVKANVNVIVIIYLIGNILFYLDKNHLKLVEPNT